MNKETSWMYCRRCNKFDDGEHSDRPCSGTPFDYEITNGKLLCKDYFYETTQ